jgi:hypothetical protein
MALGCSEAATNPPPVAGSGGSSGSSGSPSSAGDTSGSGGASGSVSTAGSPAVSGSVSASGSAPVSGSAGAGGSAGASGTAGSAGTPSLEGSGTITYERWNDIKGETVDLVPVNEAPDVTMELTLFMAPDDVGVDFSARIRGVLTAPMTGSYTFWVSSDDNSELNLSTDASPANKVRIAHVTGSPAWTGYREWNKFPTQQSAPVMLEAGKQYYIETLLKEDIAEDHIAVGWLKPGQVGSEPSEIIPGKQLSPIAP